MHNRADHHDRDRIVFGLLAVVCAAIGLVTGLLHAATTQIITAFLVAACVAFAVATFQGSTLSRAMLFVGATALSVPVVLTHGAVLPLAVIVLFLTVAALNKRYAA